ncbi:MAG: hypothetical protein DI535_16505 [Citrobacter freundii]|nr:MAG: hypothetical protein DI535_16505 [Citrobacter freundii]
MNEQWKSDSLGLLGYRFKHFEALSKSKPDSISTDQLMKYLGRPNIIRKSTYGNPRRDHVEYVYFILNDDPGGKLPSFGGLYLSFVFDAEENYLEEISEGEFCG